MTDTIEDERKTPRKSVSLRHVFDEPIQPASPVTVRPSRSVQIAAPATPQLAQTTANSAHEQINPFEILPFPNTSTTKGSSRARLDAEKTVPTASALAELADSLAHEVAAQQSLEEAVHYIQVDAFLLRRLLNSFHSVFRSAVCVVFPLVLIKQRKRANFKCAQAIGSGVCSNAIAVDC